MTPRPESPQRGQNKYSKHNKINVDKHKKRNTKNMNKKNSHRSVHHAPLHRREHCVSGLYSSHCVESDCCREKKKKRTMTRTRTMTMRTKTRTRTKTKTRTRTRRTRRILIALLTCAHLKRTFHWH